MTKTDRQTESHRLAQNSEEEALCKQSMDRKGRSARSSAKATAAVRSSPHRLNMQTAALLTSSLFSDDFCPGQLSQTAGGFGVGKVACMARLPSWQILDSVDHSNVQTIEGVNTQYKQAPQATLAEKTKVKQTNLDLVSQSASAKHMPEQQATTTLQHEQKSAVITVKANLASDKLSTVQTPSLGIKSHQQATQEKLNLATKDNIESVDKHKIESLPKLKPESLLEIDSTAENSSNAEIAKPGFCPVEMALSLLGGKYKALILWKLLEFGTLRFLQMRRLIPRATAKILTQQLRELEEHGLITRKVYPVIPPKVEYSLTELGMTIQPLLESMYQWGSQYLESLGHKVSCSMSALEPCTEQKSDDLEHKQGVERTQGASCQQPLPTCCSSSLTPNFNQEPHTKPKARCCGGRHPK